jgi:acetyl-CoA carboxylase, biotin carboxylase subunit
MQIQMADGTLAPMRQQDVQVRGHAIEVRILAEDADRNFAPSPGRICRWQAPSGEGVRVDSAVGEGTLVSPYYDSMVAKLIVHGDSREQAIGRLTQALAEFRVEGIATNIPLLRYIVAHEDYRANRTNTRWLEDTLLPAFRTHQGR